MTYHSERKDICNASWRRKKKERWQSNMARVSLRIREWTWITRRRRERRKRRIPAFRILRARAKNSTVVTIWLTHPPFRPPLLRTHSVWRLSSNFSYNQINLHPRCLSRKTIYVRCREHAVCFMFALGIIMKHFVYRYHLRYNTSEMHVIWIILFRNIRRNYPNRRWALPKIMPATRVRRSRGCESSSSTGRRFFYISYKVLFPFSCSNHVRDLIPFLT